MENTNRREFLKGSAAAASALAVPAIARGRLSANDRIRVGVVGLGGRMQSHIACLHLMADTDNVEIAAICDCDTRKLESAPERYPELTGKRLATYTEQRKLFDDKSIDAISFATQDHWHSLQTIWACQAGKNVYVEKPGSHNLFEGRQMLAAARKYKRMVQHGTQCRSNPEIREGIQKLAEGVIGDIHMSRSISFKYRGHLGKHSPRPIPPGLDWDQWVGPAPLVEYSNFHHRRWNWIWEFGNGEIAVAGIHSLDVSRWGMGLDTHPVKVQSMGGHFIHDDDQTTPNNQVASYQYADGRVIHFETRSWHTNDEAKMRDKYGFVAPNQAAGTVFYGTEGYMVIPDCSSYYTYLGRNREPGPFRFDPYDKTDEKKSRAHWNTESVPHFRNWISAIRSRNHQDLNAEIGLGRISMGLPLLANAAYRLGRSLQFDPKTEQCVDDDEANKLLAPAYREPYVVPKEV